MQNGDVETRTKEKKGEGKEGKKKKMRMRKVNEGGEESAWSLRFRFVSFLVLNKFNKI